jgi:hypothetical protein
VTPPPPSTASARAPQRRAPSRRAPVRHHRRVSGAARPATARAAAGSIALPRPAAGTLGRRAVGALCTLRDAPVVDRLVRGQGWIALLGVLLIGLVALNVSLLKLNAHNGRSAEIARALRIDNAKLSGSVSRLGSSDRLQAAAKRMGLVMPAPQDVNYLTAHPRTDARRAAKNVRLDLAAPPDEQLVSASPEAERELVAPTPSQPIVPAAAAARAAATGATGATGAMGAVGTNGTAGTPTTGTLGATSGG